jgi:hypothetical protein
MLRFSVSVSVSVCSSSLLLGKSTGGRTRIGPIRVRFSPTEFLVCRQHLRLTKFFPSLRSSSLPSTKRFVCPSNSYICFQSSVAAACPSHSWMIPSSNTTSLCDLPWSLNLCFVFDFFAFSSLSLSLGPDSPLFSHHKTTQLPRVLPKTSSPQKLV